MAQLLVSTSPRPGAPPLSSLPAAEVAAIEALQEGLLSLARSVAAREPAIVSAALDGRGLDGAVQSLDGSSLDDSSLDLGLAALVVFSLHRNPAAGALAPWFAVAGDADGALAALAAGPAHQDLGTIPALLEATPAAGSLGEQLRFLTSRWGRWLQPDLRDRLLRASDALAEQRTHRGGGPGPVPGPGFDAGPGDSGLQGPGVSDEESVRFSSDADWMPSLVLMAKHTYVWLWQLARDHGGPVERLDQIPDATLDDLADRGITGLWLIGLWERSPASATIKRRCGNPEAEPSAYSLVDYVIAERLGGEAAWQNLRDRAAQRGIRLAADMVPNHTGLDSRWLIHHPEWFVQTDAPPYPGYSFTGPDLCEHPDVTVQIEDGYWDRTDAAVVFRRADAQGERFVYHGNDGTQMPWNDTAQLDYLNPDLREAVIRTIVDVARRFPVIRFDAAMTLARRHVRRLWHPPPGEGGAVPSRSRFAVPPEVFDAALPREFWREVVERVAEEAPDTLLLAEAFWMMEGYFVRTLGMHRVYNSAFMHMLRDEDSPGFRRVLGDALAHHPAVLERFVNFVNNPDEETAVAQFGKGDKYFGVATLMATLPGLPMFGHGQFEGYEEKYGMEYGRPYRDEHADAGFLAWHEQVIVPLLKKRDWFCRGNSFALLDTAGALDPVIAYVNRGPHGERTLVAFNNSAQAVSGRALATVPSNRAAPDAEPDVRGGTLGEALNLSAKRWAAHDLRRDRWVLLQGAELREQGVQLDLGPYEVLIWDELRDLDATDWGVEDGVLALEVAE